MQNRVKVNANNPESALLLGPLFGIAPTMGIHETVREKVKSLGLTQQALAEKTNVSQSSLSRFMNNQGGIQSDAFSKILESLGAKVIFPDEERNRPREVCWVDAKIVGAINGAPPPHAEKYLAVPLAEGPVAAGPGMIPEDEVKSWVLVFRDHPSVRFRSNLVAIEIGKGQESMEPLLHPLDLVLVDKDDTRPEPDGQIFLVREPDASVTVKRVYVQRDEAEIMLNFVSDNPNKRRYPPMLYNLRSKYGGEIANAIVGKCVWAWTDLTRK